MGIVSKIVKLGITGLGVKEISDYAKEVREEGRDPWSPSTFFGHFGNKAKDTVTDLLKRHQSGMDNQPQKKNMGGMANARKKGMGLEMAEGGIALKLVPSDKKGLKKLPKKVRNKMGYMKKGGAVKKRAKSSSKKSRGTGAAIRGTKFKGVF